jgi:hypothetical protein
MVDLNFYKSTKTVRLQMVHVHYWYPNNIQIVSVGLYVPAKAYILPWIKQQRLSAVKVRRKLILRTFFIYSLLTRASNLSAF